MKTTNNERLLYRIKAIAECEQKFPNYFINQILLFLKEDIKNGMYDMEGENE